MAEPKRARESSTADPSTRGKDATENAGVATVVEKLAMKTSARSSSRRQALGARSFSARTSPRRRAVPRRACTWSFPTSRRLARSYLATASRSARCSTPPASTLARTSPTCLDGCRSAVQIPGMAATARSPRSVIRMATAGCSRKSQRGCPVASAQPRRPSHRQMISRARFGRARRAREPHRRG
jgi:hypothetical protein